MDAAKVRFLFGDVIPDGIDPDDADDRALLLEQEFDSVEDLVVAGHAIWEAIATQIAEDDPPDVWSTATRLLDLGLDRRRVMAALALAMTSVLHEVLRTNREFDRVDYLTALDRLPLPSAEVIEDAILGVVRQAPGIVADEVDALVLERLGAKPDDQMLETLVDQATEFLVDGDGPLTWLSGDRTVHVRDLTAGIVLTHRLSESERQAEILPVAFDLAGFGRLDDLRVARGELAVLAIGDGVQAWGGPDGWLDEHPAETLLAVRVETDGLVRLEALAEEPAIEPDLVERLGSVYHANVEEAWMPVTGEELILELLFEVPSVFSSPRPPLSELCEAAGLERRGHEVAHEPGVWHQAVKARQSGRLFRLLDDDNQRKAAALAMDAADDPGLNADQLRLVATGMRPPNVLDVVVTELLDSEASLEPERVVEFAERLLAASVGRDVAIGRYLAAVAAERVGQPEVAEAHLQLALEADPDWPPTLDRAAWYASDRGDAVGAVRLWQRLRCTDTDEFRTVADFAHREPRLGRNDPCWCGSGRKHKFCHLGRPPTPPLAERVGWLCRKATSYLQRRGLPARAEVFALATARAVDPGDPRSLAEAFADPIVIDAALTEGGWFESFVADRGALLPDDEALLAQAWTLIPRTVYEMLEIHPGAEVTVRDLQTGECFAVTERTFSLQTTIGELICARAVPDGQGHQFVGGLFVVGPGTERDVLELLDRGDGDELCQYVSRLHRAPVIETREGEPMVACTAVIEVGDHDAARIILDRHYRGEGDGWVELHPLNDDEDIVRAQLHLDGSDLTITTHSEPRIERVLDVVLTEVAGARVVSDTRLPIEPGNFSTLKQPRAETLTPVAEPEVIAEIQDRMERRWCAESVPALGGLTPHQAAADPTRIEELDRLVNSFPDPDALPAGMITMRPERLRNLLHLE